jgi:hypothetical protein
MPRWKKKGDFLEHDLLGRKFPKTIIYFPVYPVAA